MAELLPVIMTGVQVAKKIVEFFKEKRKPTPTPSKEATKLLEIHEEEIKPKATAILENTMAYTDKHLSSEQFKNVLNATINELSRPSIFYRDKLIEMNSVLNRGLGKIDLYYMLISKSSDKVKDIVVLQSRLFLPRINNDFEKFLAIMKQLDSAVVAEVKNNFCGAFTECESDLEAQLTRLEDLKNIGTDPSASDIENWLNAFREYAECCLVGVNKSITFA